MPSRAAAPTDPTAASRTLLELVAELMEESFAVMGEGQILGTMPAYLERFGAGNARYVAKHFLAEAVVKGPRSALSAMDLISRVTGTKYTTEDADAGVIKRLHSCEFLEAFEDRGEFPRAMMCMLHRAAYQGSVNGLVEEDDGFDVQLTRRILFDDPGCDFLVVPRGDTSTDDAALPMAHEPDAEDRADLAYHFYTFILTSFIDYLTHQLPDARVEEMLRVVSSRVGKKVGTLLAGRYDLDGPEEVARAVLRTAGRTVEDEGLKVTACPQAEHILSTAAGDEEERMRVVANACRMCKHVVGGAVRGASADADVGRERSIALGDDHCDFEVTHG